jgi:hypothetical protein
MAVWDLNSNLDVFSMQTFLRGLIYVRCMSAEGGHLGWRSGSLDTILKIDHLRTIHAMFVLNWLTGFREEKIF